MKKKYFDEEEFEYLFDEINELNEERDEYENRFFSDMETDDFENVQLFRNVQFL